ncbi:hypothetical protein SDRG_00424 [Saprolegnia diclina VS20]|uniref:Alcohol dehydrogenase-like N-terminal domain-containing protein n=1 Tax=Saprolegnia diclina (strain VS20) TaxID=1156394 RepID=T0SIE2_SAPDV|nr:hypothetical protein SDRG_00424 [Saprolegnia diclina VS20]EQC42697.1 hypothetical protein SDRG_00424 [Saprolegnia diclina VS20]|eukprot:XP_008604120.1 hypothetical protein SDRG_00424 [Saprolegnia diclina VS20]
MASNNIYHGQAAFAPGLDVKPHTYEARPFDEENGIEIKVSHCGICASDLHTISGGWGPIQYPLVVGHEIVGHVVRTGSKVDSIKYAIGTRVGVGAQCGSCLDCHQCNMHEEQVDITDGITKEGVLTQCNGCLRFQQGAKDSNGAFVECHLESLELMSICLKKLHGLGRDIKLMDASFMWTEPHSKRVKLKLTIRKEVCVSQRSRSCSKCD